MFLSPACGDPSSWDLEYNEPALRWQLSPALLASLYLTNTKTSSSSGKRKLKPRGFVDYLGFPLSLPSSAFLGAGLHGLSMDSFSRSLPKASPACPETPFLGRGPSATKNCQGLLPHSPASAERDTGLFCVPHCPVVKAVILARREGWSGQRTRRSIATLMSHEDHEWLYF